MLPQNKRGQYPIGAVVRIKKTGQFAIIKERSFLKSEENFLNYLAIVEGRCEGLYALYDDDIELECLPTTSYQ